MYKERITAEIFINIDDELSTKEKSTDACDYIFSECSRNIDNLREVAKYSVHLHGFLVKKKRWFRMIKTCHRKISMEKKNTSNWKQTCS